MFYIDFTSPEGHSYRIDLATHPITYHCPLCGEETTLTLDDDPDWCLSCYKKRKENEKKRLQKRSRQSLIEQVNAHCGTHINEATLKEWKAETAHMSLEEKGDFVAKQIRQLRSPSDQNIIP